MEITERRTVDIVTLSLSGKLDTTTANAFEQKILSRIECGDRRFIIDLAQLDYISSSGLRVLASAASVWPMIMARSCCVRLRIQ